MVLEDEQPQMPAQAGLSARRRGEAPRPRRSGESSSAGHEDERSEATDLMERVVVRANLLAALKRVERNKGSAGVDGMTVGELRAHLMTAWPRTSGDSSNPANEGRLKSGQRGEPARRVFLCLCLASVQPGLRPIAPGSAPDDVSVV